MTNFIKKQLFSPPKTSFRRFAHYLVHKPSSQKNAPSPHLEGVFYLRTAPDPSDSPTTIRVIRFKIVRLPPNSKIIRWIWFISAVLTRFILFISMVLTHSSCFYSKVLFAVVHFNANVLIASGSRPSVRRLTTSPLGSTRSPTFGSGVAKFAVPLSTDH